MTAKVAAAPGRELLLACARLHAGEADRGRVRALAADGIDWPAFVQLAMEHRVAPLVSATLQAHAVDLVPPEEALRLHAACTALAGRHFALARTLVQLLGWLRDESVQALPFKGPTLAVLAHGALALRHAGDLDVLVPEPQVARATAILVARGFDVIDEGCDHHVRLERRSDQLIVEVHWRLMERGYRLGLAEALLFKQPTHVTLAGTSVPTLPSLELMIFLCAHGLKHDFERLGWVVDIAALARSPHAPDIGALLALARRCRAERVLAVGLLLAHDLVGGRLDEAALRWARRDAAASAIAQEMTDLLLGRAPMPRTSGARVGTWLKTMSVPDRAAWTLDRLRGTLRLNERDDAFAGVGRQRTVASRYALKVARLLRYYGVRPGAFVRLLKDNFGFR